MKKLLSMMLVMAVFFGFSTSVFANTGDKQYDQAIALLEVANADIDAKIEIAVQQADGLQRYYLNEIRLIEQKDIDTLNSEKVKLEAAITSGKYSKSDVNEMNRKIAEIDGKILTISQQLETNLALISQDIEEFMSTVGPEVTPTNDALYAAVNVLTEKLNKKSKKYVTVTDYYTKKLNEVVQECYNVTLAISNDAIARAASKGVIAENSWRLVRFGHLWVWIDPIKVVGRH